MNDVPDNLFGGFNARHDFVSPTAISFRNRDAIEPRWNGFPRVFRQEARFLIGTCFYRKARDDGFSKGNSRTDC